MRILFWVWLLSHSMFDLQSTSDRSFICNDWIWKMWNVSMIFNIDIVFLTRSGSFYSPYHWGFLKDPEPYVVLCVFADWLCVPAIRNKTEDQSAPVLPAWVLVCVCTWCVLKNDAIAQIPQQWRLTVTALGS